MKRGDIYWADLSPRSGSEQTGRRPVIVVSNDGFNQSPNWQSILTVPLTTSTAQASRGRTSIFLPKGSGGLNRACIAVCHQVTTVDRSKLLRFIGTLDPQLLSQVDTGLKNALQLS